MAENDLKLYELGYHIVPTIAQGKIEDTVREISSLVEKHGGSVRGGEFPEMRDLAYSVTQRTDSGKKEYKTAYFGWMNIDLSAEEIDSLKEELRSLDSVLRFILLTKKEDDTPEGDMFDRGSKSAKKEEKKMDEEEIDEKIDELVEEADE
ncbi:MAG: 30S ribosomal protein S6 [Candidatus Paceibacterota bacterium]